MKLWGESGSLGGKGSNKSSGHLLENGNCRPMYTQWERLYIYRTENPLICETEEKTKIRYLTVHGSGWCPSRDSTHYVHLNPVSLGFSWESLVWYKRQDEFWVLSRILPRRSLKDTTAFTRSVRLCISGDRCIPITCDNTYNHTDFLT